MRGGYETQALLGAPENKGFGQVGCIVAAPGPSLTADVIHRVRFARWFDGFHVIAVQDAYRVMPWADAMYGCNPSWWRVHKHCAGFRGQKWSSHEVGRDSFNDKAEIAKLYDVRLVNGRNGSGFSMEPGVIHYGSNSGFQAINLALLCGARYIVLVGFDMRHVNGKAHFFGNHPKELHNNEDAHYRAYVEHFDRAAKQLPAGVRIVNATPGSALTSFPMVELSDALGLSAAIECNRMLRRDGAVADAGSDRGGAPQGLCAHGVQ